ncbi:MAG: hypothetical protein V3R93_05880 [Candidatus Hydrothermarchaeaceae archaeon]
MMGWFDKLKELVKIDIKDSFNINIRSNNVSKPVEYNEEIKSVSINLEKLSPSEKEAFEQILEGAVRDNKVLLEQNSEKLIQDFRSEESSRDTKSLLSYFEDKIPPDDFEALRAALYIRTLFGRTRDNRPDSRDGEGGQHQGRTEGGSR